jgi:hypothetical protein
MLPQPPESPKRRRTGLIIGAIAGVLVLMGLTAAAAVALTNGGDKKAATASASAAPAITATTAAATTPAAAATTIPPPPPLDERTVCIMLVPTAQDAVDVVLAMASHPDGTTVDRAKLSKAITDLRTIEQVSPPTLKADAQTQLSTLQEIDSVLSGAGNRTIYFEDFKASGLRIGARCMPYATK